MVFFQTDYLGVSFLHNLIKLDFVVFGPLVYRQLFHMQHIRIMLIELIISFDFIVTIPLTNDISSVTFVPWM